MKLTKIQFLLILIPSILMIFLFISLILKDLNFFSKFLYHPIIALLVFILLLVGIYRFLKSK